jgi:hypothetical protein
MKDFTGVCRGSVLNCLVMKRLFFVTVVTLASALSIQKVAAADSFDPVFGFYRPELFTDADSSNLLKDLPLREFLDGRLPGSTLLGKMGTAPVANFPTALLSAQPSNKRTAAVSEHIIDPKDGKDYSSIESAAMEKASLVWTGGEVGLMYGHVTGKWGGDLFNTYVTGGVGNDKMQINVGASYEEFDGHGTRWRP